MYYMAKVDFKRTIVSIIVNYCCPVNDYLCPNYILTSCTSCSLQKEEPCFKASSTSVSQVCLHSTWEDKGVKTGLVDEDGLCLVVRTSVAKRDGGFVFALYMLSNRISSITIPYCPSNILGANQGLPIVYHSFFHLSEAKVSKNESTNQSLKCNCLID